MRLTVRASTITGLYHHQLGCEYFPGSFSDLCLIHLMETRNFKQVKYLNSEKKTQITDDEHENISIIFKFSEN